MPLRMKQVMCINWGTRYGAQYINRLYAMVSRNITAPWKFVCFTDTRNGLHPDIICHDLPPLRTELPQNTRGKWQKSRLWAKSLPDLDGPVLFMDLDVVITGSLDPFFEYGSPDDIVLANNPAKPFHRSGQTSIYRMPVGGLEPLQEKFIADPQAAADRYEWEQSFVTHNAPGGIKLWPRRWVRHFRIDCIPAFPLNFLLPPRLPADARVVIFAGALNPTDAMAGQYSQDLPFLSPYAHIRRSLAQRSGFKGLRRFLYPTRWIADHWRE